MDYIEQMLDRKVSSLEVLIDRNNRDLKFLNQLTDRAREDIRLLDHTKGKEAGKIGEGHGKLITDDIRFYMQLLRKGQSPSLEKQSSNQRSGVGHQALDNFERMSAGSQLDKLNASACTTTKHKRPASKSQPRLKLAFPERIAVENFARTPPKIHPQSRAVPSSKQSPSPMQKPGGSSKYLETKAKVDTNLANVRAAESKGQMGTPKQTRRCSVSKSSSLTGLPTLTKSVGKTNNRSSISSLQVATQATLKVASRALESLNKQASGLELRFENSGKHGHDVQQTEESRFESGDSVIKTQAKIEHWRQRFRQLGCEFDETHRVSTELVSFEENSIGMKLSESRKESEEIGLMSHTPAGLAKGMMTDTLRSSTLSQGGGRGLSDLELRGQRKPPLLPAHIGVQWSQRGLSGQAGSHLKGKEKTGEEDALLPQSVDTLEESSVFKVRMHGNDKTHNIFLDTLKDPDVLKDITAHNQINQPLVRRHTRFDGGIKSSERGHISELMRNGHPIQSSSRDSSRAENYSKDLKKPAPSMALGILENQKSENLPYEQSNKGLTYSEQQKKQVQNKTPRVEQLSLSVTDQDSIKTRSAKNIKQQKCLIPRLREDEYDTNEFCKEKGNILRDLGIASELPSSMEGYRNVPAGRFR
jgi:hypothetical protein